MHRSSVVFSALALVLIACGKSGTPPAEQPDRVTGPEPGRSTAEAPPPAAAPSPATDADFGEAEASDAAPAEPAPPASRSQGAPILERSQKKIEDRPGLATLWGEDRRSSIHFTDFVRADERRPFFVTSLFYNDEDGVRAMAAQSGLSDFRDSGHSDGGPVTLRLLDENGRPIPSFDVASRNYVVGSPRARYTVQVQNNTGVRIEAVATVDGLDVIDGQPGSLDKRGYLVDPFGSVEIDGFRRSVNTVAAFRFGSVRDSYAAGKGDARNVGVIGVAVFNEAGSDLRWTRQEVRARHDADPFPGRFAEPAR
jgi:hypothetical protein